MPLFSSTLPISIAGPATNKAMAMPNRKPIIAPGKDVADSASSTARRTSRVMNARWLMGHYSPTERSVMYQSDLNCA